MITERDSNLRDAQRKIASNFQKKFIVGNSLPKDSFTRFKSKCRKQIVGSFILVCG